MNLPLTKHIIGITTGDINGIGIEIILKTFSDHRILDFCTPVIFASNKLINYYKKILGDNVQYNGTKDWQKINPKTINIFNCWDEEVVMNVGQITEAGGKYAIRSLQVATQFLKEGKINGIVTCPINKANTQLHDFKYTGHTPYFKDTFAAKDVVMMLCSNALRVALITEHIPISDIANHITIEKIYSKGTIIKESLLKDFGIDKPKIALLSLNPHASDNGLIGTEENTIILPAIEKLQQNNMLAFGPYSADAFFARQHDKQFDCVVAMYHDQGLIPFKSFDQGMGVNYTAGLPIVRTSPDHGTALDIAGKNIADPRSFLESLFQCIDILNQRQNFSENTKNKLVPTKNLHQLKRTKEDIVEE